MLTGMKPLPKALIIATPIVIALVLYLKFKPEHKEEPVTQAPIVVTPVPAETSSAPISIEAPKTEPEAPKPVQPDPEVEAAANAGMKNLLNKGRKQ